MRQRVLELAASALRSISAHRARIDDLNVYPVPDGDTGTNLTLTMRAIVESLESEGSEDRAALAHEVSRAALMGARGNSGVILSQIVRGATEVLAESDDLARALRAASDAAYRAVKRPVEGTMLTAIRAMADAAQGRSDLRGIVQAGDESVLRTRDQLAVLREAGVVDAGAAGLVEIVRGIAAVLTGEELPEAPVAEETAGLDAVHRELSRYRYCTVFVVEGAGLNAGTIEDELEPLGDSLLVVGDPTALKVHVHTDDPGRALSLGVAHGTIGGVEIADMHAQTVRREERLLQSVGEPQPDIPVSAVVAVAAGTGNRRLFERLGAHVVDGLRTMNPSTSDLLASIEAAGAAEVLVLPNNGNVIMSAEQAADHASVQTRVVPTRTIQAGLAAIVAFDPHRSAEDNAAAMTVAAASVATGAVTIASREVRLNGVAIEKGSWLGLADGEPVTGGATFDDVARDVAERLLAEPREVLTLLTGEEPQPLDALVGDLQRRHPGVELEIHEGGQPHYTLLLAAE